ncbi:MAG TPA: hypothetical protein VF677_00260 [Flavobacterium sp.]
MESNKKWVTIATKSNNTLKYSFSVDEKLIGTIDIILKRLVRKESHFQNLKYKDKDLRLKYRNNPTAEYVIFDDEKEVLHYGLSGTKIKIGLEGTDDYLLDYVLWYLFSGIALESTGNNFVFTY